MRTFNALLIAIMVFGTSGCLNDRTQSMLTTCQSLLGDDDHSGDQRFIRDAEQQLASLKKPQNRITAGLRDFQDHDAMTLKPALEECLFQIKARQS